jgi:hypothetical protein
VVAPEASDEDSEAEAEELAVEKARNPMARAGGPGRPVNGVASCASLRCVQVLEVRTRRGRKEFLVSWAGAGTARCIDGVALAGGPSEGHY